MYVIVVVAAVVVFPNTSRVTPEIRRVWLGYWSKADTSLAERLVHSLRMKGINDIQGPPSNSAL